MSEPVPPPADQLPPSAARSIAQRTREMLHDVFVHDFAEKAHIGRAAAAEGYGLKAETYARPFPGSSNTTVYQTAPSSSPLGKLAAAAVAGGALAWFAAQRQPDPPTPPAAPPPVAAPAPATADAAANARVRVFWGERELEPGTPYRAELDAEVAE